jgi:hypothetical protein
MCIVGDNCSRLGANGPVEHGALISNQCEVFAIDDQKTSDHMDLEGDVAEGLSRIATRLEPDRVSRPCGIDGALHTFAAPVTTIAIL